MGRSDGQLQGLRYKATKFAMAASNYSALG